MRVSTFPDDYNLKKIQKIRYKNTSMWITPRYLDHYLQHTYEEYSISLLQSLLKPNDVFLDVGAHYGIYSLMAHQAQPTVHVIAIEPIAENAEILEKNLQINHVPYEIIRAGASDQTGYSVFNKTEASDSASFYEHPNTTQLEAIHIPTVTVDSVTKNKKIDIVKIDVEGHEIPVLRGMKRCFQQNPKVRLFVELNPKMQKKTGYSSMELIHAIESYGFDLYLIIEDLKRWYRLSDNPFAVDVLMAGHTYANLYCIPKRESLSFVEFMHNSALTGAERSSVTMTKLLLSKGAIGSIVLPRPGMVDEEISNIPVSRYLLLFSWWAGPIHLNLHLARQMYQSFRNTLSFLYELEKINPLFISSRTVTIPWGAIASFLACKPHVWHIHEFGEKDHDLHFYFGWKQMMKVMSMMSDVISFNSNAVRKGFASVIQNKKTFIFSTPVFINTEQLKQRMPKLFRKRGAVKILVLGNISKSKGQYIALQAISQLIEEGILFEVLFLGLQAQHEYMEVLKNYLRKHPRVRTLVHFHEFVTNPYPYLQQADALIMPSTMEAYGRSALEALSLGKTVIASNSGGLPEIISNRVNGLLFESGNVEDLKKKLKYFYAHPQYRKKWAKNGFISLKELERNYNRNVNEYVQIIREISQKRSRRLLLLKKIVIFVGRTFKKIVHSISS